jgi:hypothetical protein
MIQVEQTLFYTVVRRYGSRIGEPSGARQSGSKRSKGNVKSRSGVEE